MPSISERVRFAVGDRRPEGTLGLGALDVGVDPLVIAGQIGELVDHLLCDLAPLARAHDLIGQRL
ncbi:MAG TPA: hypothetical protein VGF15_04930 [Solirubrobacteraceae bacterium]|jgi:hypothetical protein